MAKATVNINTYPAPYGTGINRALNRVYIDKSKCVL